jgi:hypothetical protein
MHLIARLIAVGVILSPQAIAQEAPTKESCIESNVATQRSRLAGKLRAARKAAIACAAAACPAPIQAECAGWLRQIDLALPRVVLHAYDGRGVRLDRVRVFVDGELVATTLDGRSVPIDPGTHEFRFVRPDGASITLRQTIAEGETRRSIDARFAAAPVVQEPEPAEGGFSPVLPLVLVGVAGASSFAFFALRGRSLENEFREDCAPECDRDDTRSVRTSYLIADISLGISLVSFGAAAWFAFSAPDDRRRGAPAILQGRF